MGGVEQVRVWRLPERGIGPVHIPGVPFGNLPLQLCISDVLTPAFQFRQAPTHPHGGISNGGAIRWMRFN